MNCAVSMPLFAQGIAGSTTASGIPVIVPGMQTLPFHSRISEQLIIDANAFATLPTTPGEVTFGVFVDGSFVSGSEFGTSFSSNIDAVATTQSTTLVVPVAAGAHIVDVRWSTDTASKLDAGNLRVLRFVCSVLHCLPACGVNAPLLTTGIPGSFIPGDAGGGGAAPLVVPGMVVTLNSRTAETLLIDANALTTFSGIPVSGEYSVNFVVFVDGVAVSGSHLDFGLGHFGTTITVSSTFSQGATLVVPVAAGTHTVDVRWFGFASSAGSVNTLDAGNLRVVRLACN